jgi:hypothetical protein
VTDAGELWLPIGLAVTFVACVIAFRWWAARRLFGTPRLVPAGPDPRPGETLAATLEAAPYLAEAREVRFELVELDPSGFSRGRHRRRVRAAAAVPFSAFQIVPGFARIPVSLPVPADALPTFTERKLGFSLLSEFLIGMREAEHAWEVRAAAEVNGTSYRSAFRVTVAPSVAVATDAAYTPRPIVIPPSDKQRA